jgi:hypothetical protein
MAADNIENSLMLWVVELRDKGSLYRELTPDQTYDMTLAAAAYLGPRLVEDQAFTQDIAIRRNRGWFGAFGHVGLVSGQSVAYAFKPGNEPPFGVCLAQSYPYGIPELAPYRVSPPQAEGVVLTEAGELKQYDVAWAREKIHDGVRVITGPSEASDSSVVDYANQEGMLHPHTVLQGIVAVASEVYRPAWEGLVLRPEVAQRMHPRL